jgi:hypothetical protein
MMVITLTPFPRQIKKGPAIVVAYNKAHQFLKFWGFKPLLHLLGNESAQALQYSMADSKIKFQLAPPHVHHHNATERAIRTFKNHFIAGLCSTNNNFPPDL